MTDSELANYEYRMFFRPPEIPYDRRDQGGRMGGSMDAHVGTLYLLRREMIETMFDVSKSSPYPV